MTGAAEASRASGPSSPSRLSRPPTPKPRPMSRSWARCLPETACLENQSEAWALPNHVEEGGELVSRQEPSLSPAVRDLFAETGLSISPDERPAAPPPVLAGQTPSIPAGERVPGGRGNRHGRRRDLSAGDPSRQFPGSRHAHRRNSPRRRRASGLQRRPAAPSPRLLQAKFMRLLRPWRMLRLSNGATNTAAAKAAARRRCAAVGDAAAAAGRRPAALARRGPLLCLSGPAAWLSPRPDRQQ